MKALERVKMILSHALEDLEWLGLEPVWKLKSNRPFTMDEQGKPMFYMDTWETIPEDDIVKEENPFWNFVHLMAEIDKAHMAEIDKEYTADEMQVRGIFKPEVNKAVWRRMSEKKYKAENPLQLAILRMYFQHRKWFKEYNESAFKRDMVAGGIFDAKSDDVKNIKLSYFQDALYKAIEKMGFNDLNIGTDDFIILKRFFSKFRMEGLKMKSKYKKWEDAMKTIETMFSDIG